MCVCVCVCVCVFLCVLESIYIYDIHDNLGRFQQVLFLTFVHLHGYRAYRS